MSLTARERLQACIKNDPALDRSPVALWRHFPVDDQRPETLAAATLDFQHHYNFDLVKVTPASSFAIKDCTFSHVLLQNKHPHKILNEKIYI